MNLRRRLFAIMMAMTVALFGVASSGAASACAGSMTVMDMCGSAGCDRDSPAHDCALACAPACAAALPALLAPISPDLPPIIFEATGRGFVASITIGPEPPPPRMKPELRNSDHIGEIS